MSTLNRPNTFQRRYYRRESGLMIPSKSLVLGADLLDLTAYAPTRAWNFAKTSTITHTGGLVDSVAGTWGTATACTGSGGGRPTTATRTISGYNTLDFDGSSDFLSDTTYRVGDGGTMLYTCVMVVEFDNPIVGNPVGSSATNGLCLQAGTSLNKQGTSVVATYSPGLVHSTPYVLSFTYRGISVGSDVYWNVNGTTETDGHATNMTGAGTFRIGLGNGSEYFNGKMGMCALWNYAVSTSTLNAIASAVKSSWAI